MYNPPRFKSNDRDAAFELMEQNPFATVISVVDGMPFISHLPLTPERAGEEIELIGHLARANPHSRFLPSGEVRIVFQGAHTYVTPKWYAKNNVPTWNYSVVHISGKIEMIEDPDGILSCLKTLVSHAERKWPSGWEFFIPGDLAKSFSKQIVGFKVRVTEIDFKKKLSQTLSVEDREGVLRGLEARGDDNSRGVLEDMRQHFSALGLKSP